MALLVGLLSMQRGHVHCTVAWHPKLTLELCSLNYQGVQADIRVCCFAGWRRSAGPAIRIQVPVVARRDNSDRPQLCHFVIHALVRHRPAIVCEQPATIICGIQSFMRRWKASSMQYEDAEQAQNCLHHVSARGWEQPNTPVWQLVQDGISRSQCFAHLRRQLCILHEDKGKRFNRCALHAAWF